MPFYTIQQGDTLMALAAANGLTDYKEILDDAQNGELKKVRPDPGVLKPGDNFFIPNKEMRHDPSAVDAKHSFNVSRPKAWLRLRLQDVDGTALAGKAFELTVAGKTTKGTTGSDGVIKQAVPIDAQSGTLKVDGGIEWELKIGHRDPLTETSGIKHALANLGHFSGSIDDTVDDDLTAAVKAFQVAAGIEVTASIDDALRQKLAGAYGPP
jgi:hypothetical protein